MLRLLENKKKNMEEQKIKVAIIEDESAFECFGKQAKEEGFDVVTALDGEIGVKVVRESLPDIILLDIIMPKVNGFEVLAQLNQDPVLAKIPVIIPIPPAGGNRQGAVFGSKRLFGKGGI